MALADFLPINQIAEEAAADIQKDLLDTMGGFGMRFGLNPKTRSLRIGTKAYTGQRDGVVDKIAIRFPRHGVYRAKGVGKGTKMSQVGTTRRKPADWFNAVIKRHHATLAARMALAGQEGVLKEVQKMLIK